MLEAVWDVRVGGPRRIGEVAGYPRTALPLEFEVSGLAGEVAEAEPGQVAEDAPSGQITLGRQGRTRSAETCPSERYCGQRTVAGVEIR